MTPVFELQGVRYAYSGEGEEVLRGVTWSVEAGRHEAVLGPNGAGKSTLLRVLLGLHRPTAGRALLWGRDARDWPRREVARRVGVVSQERPPEVPLTVRQFADMGRNPYLRAWEPPGPEDGRAVERALERTDMTELAERPIAALSGGELQRAKLARALAQEPRALVLDEPTAHLDLGHEMRFYERVASLVRDEGMTVVSVTHRLSLASRFGGRMLLLSAGRVVARGAPSEVLTPEHVGRVFGWPVEVRDAGRLGLQVVPLAPGEEP